MSACRRCSGTALQWPAAVTAITPPGYLLAVCCDSRPCSPCLRTGRVSISTASCSWAPNGWETAILPRRPHQCPPTGSRSAFYTEMALIFWVTGVRHTGQRLTFAAHAKQQQWCPHGTSVQSTVESKHTWTYVRETTLSTRRGVRE